MVVVHNRDHPGNLQNTGFLSGFWPREVKMRCNGILGGQSGMIFLEAKHMAN